MQENSASSKDEGKQQQRGGGDHQPVRSRWTPKAEQILILESIFNSGMVNPPKEETVRIRKLLEKFGAVGDANVFYWFQNRRSRSRRRQRQMQATVLLQQHQHHHHQPYSSATPTASIQSSYEAAAADPSCNNIPIGFANSAAYNNSPPPSYDHLMVMGGSSSSSSSSSASSSSSSCGVVVGGGDHHHHQDAGVESIYSSYFYDHQMGMEAAPGLGLGVTSILCPSSHPPASSTHHNLHHHHQNGGYSNSSSITVFINGLATEVPRGPLDMKAMFGSEDLVLLHSSGLPLPTNEYGFIMRSLHHGESYFLVSKTSINWQSKS